MNSSIDLNVMCHFSVLATKNTQKSRLLQKFSNILRNLQEIKTIFSNSEKSTKIKKTKTGGGTGGHPICLYVRTFNRHRALYHEMGLL